ncbi:MAG TPA: EamA/RhaT family transporter, partial [Acetobacteraceae bacterium]
MENPLRGVALFMGATLCFSASDTLAKFLGQSLPPIEITWIRYGVFVAVAFAIFWGSGGRSLAVRNPVAQVTRGAALVGSAVFFVTALTAMPLADA